MSTPQNSAQRLRPGLKINPKFSPRPASINMSASGWSMLLTLKSSLMTSCPLAKVFATRPLLITNFTGSTVRAEIVSPPKSPATNRRGKVRQYPVSSLRRITSPRPAIPRKSRRVAWRGLAIFTMPNAPMGINWPPSVSTAFLVIHESFSFVISAKAENAKRVSSKAVLRK